MGNEFFTLTEILPDAVKTLILSLHAIAIKINTHENGQSGLGARETR